MTFSSPVRALLAALLPFGALLAQQPSNWTTITLPAGATTPNSIGTTTTFRTATDVWLYSGITKQWTTVAVPATATIFQANDYVVVRDGNTFHGFASHVGTVDTITTVGSPLVVSGPASSSWVTLVADGSLVYAFGAFNGAWQSAPIATSAPTMVANRLIAEIDDGVTIYGLSAHHGLLVPTPSSPGTTLSALGEAEIGTAHATATGTFRAFSAQQNAWITATLPTGFTTAQSNEIALAWSGAQIWGSSGLTGTLTSYTASAPIGTVTLSEGAAAFVDGGLAVCFGSGRGAFATLPVTTTPTFSLKYHYVLVQDGTTSTPFSSVTNTFGAPIAGGPFTFTLNDAAGYATNGTNGYAYSPILNLWSPTPAVAATQVAVVRDSVVLVHASGFEAWSARYGNWRSLATSPAATFLAPGTGATFLVTDGFTLHVFDARLDRWASVTGTGPMTTKVSRHTAMAHDGAFGYGFGQPSGEWWVEPLTASPTTFDTASSIGTLRHGTQLSVYSVQGSFTYVGRYPEFTQAINLGNTLRMHQSAPAGSLLVMIVGIAPAYVPLPGLGTLYLDPNTAFTGVWPNLVDGDGYLDMSIALPNNPSLVGAPLHLQNVVLQPNGVLWLSSSIAPILF